jgi:TatD DNase family protein
MSPVYVDTHAHLYLNEFEEDRDSVIEAALNHGVEKILLPNIDSSSVGPMNRLADHYPGTCLPMMGLHPTSVKDGYIRELLLVEQEVKMRRYVAIGEIGIDLYWDKEHLKEQQLAFSAQLDLALIHKLPVVIHARESFPEILDIVEGYRNKGLKGVFHAFTGDTEIARSIIGLGFMLGIGGIITYKNSTLPVVVREIGVEHLLLETDAPYLTPVPFRGKRNESSYIPYVAEAIELITGMPREEIASITTANACELFQI